MVKTVKMFTVFSEQSQLTILLEGGSFLFSQRALLQLSLRRSTGITTGKILWSFGGDRVLLNTFLPISIQTLYHKNPPNKREQVFNEHHCEL